MTHNEEKNQSIETNPEPTQMLDQKKSIKIVLITYFHMFKKLSRDMGNIKKIQIKLLQMKTTMSEIKTIVYGINSALEIAK